MTDSRLSLRWVDARHTDRSDLQQFICANPPKAKYIRGRGKHHPAPWELEVQSSIRGLRPPLGSRDRLLLGYSHDDENLVAVIWLGVDTDGKHFIIPGIAVSTVYRGKGFGHQIVAVAMDELRRWQQFSYPSITAVFARIHPSNEASQSVFERAGFEDLEMIYDGYQVWVAEVRPDVLRPVVI